MNIGFIGVGGVAQPHLQNLQKMKGVNITAVCDLDLARAQKVADAYGAESYDDYHEMLRTEELDGCYVCVIPGAHGNIELDLATAGIPFYTEKPVHLNLATCRKVVDALEKKGTINCVGYHWRYMSSTQTVKKFVDKHRVSLVEGSWYGGMPGVPWWRQIELSGGQLVEQSTHIVDMARYLAGEIHTVYALGAQGAMADIENYDIDDVSVVTLQFDSGAIGQITSGCIAGEHGGSKVEIAVKGRDWQAQVGGQAKVSDKKGARDVPEPQSWQEQLGNGDKAFINAIKNDSSAKILSDYISGAQTLAVTLAANQSMKSGKPVKVTRFV
jgi:myo-inositol 2-dehydrogenase/D-chiro-inositol 1-dehydrogenase